MKELFVVRHAKSSWDSPHLDDHDRPLNQRGLRDAHFLSRHLKKLGETPEIIISSSAKRALMTASYFHEVFKMKNKQLKISKSLYHAGVFEIFEVVQDISEKYSQVMIIGHNPGFTYFVNKFTNHPLANLPTCGIVKLGIKAPSWKEFNPQNTWIDNYIYPKQFFK